MDVLGRIEAMRAQEDATNSCYNYFQGCTSKAGIDEECRKSMVQWCQKMQRALKLIPETAWISISFFDRYLSSGKGKSSQALQDRYKFQLAAITSFYTAVKIYEHVELNVATLAKLCRGYYAEADIISMEEDILFALDWRVACPTPMEFVRHLLELLPEKVKSSDDLLEACEKHVHHTSTDFYFTFCKPSVVAASCLASTLTGTDILSSSERQAFWLHLAKITDLIDIMETQNKLLKGRTLCKPISVSKKPSKPTVSKKPSKLAVTSKAITVSQTKTIVSSRNSSPVCVTQAAPQA